jgi:sulfur carrier protein
MVNHFSRRCVAGFRVFQGVSMQIVVNGQVRTLDEPVTVEALLHTLGVQGQRVAVEVNQEIVPRSRHGEFQIRDHDRVEVVVAIGGG